MIQHVRFTELPVIDQDRALAFYTDAVGLAVRQDAPYEDDWRWIELEIPGSPTGIVLSRSDEADQSSTPRLVLEVADVQAVYEALSEKGVEFTELPTRAPWNDAETYALFRDSEGNTVLIGSS